MGIRVGWATDTHLDYTDDEGLAAFRESLGDARLDALLLTGDIALAGSVEGWLDRLHEWLCVPIHFVLGNHDYFGDSIAAVRARMGLLTERRDGVGWLPVSRIVPLGRETALIGHDGWADARCGDYARSRVTFGEYFLVEELTGLEQDERFLRLNALGDEAATHFRDVLPAVLDRFRHVIVLMHFPPFPEACWHDGAISLDEWLPHLACKAAGDVLFEAMRARPDVSLRVLCGHTHDAGDVLLLPNLRVTTGGARYGRPQLQDVLEID